MNQFISELYHTLIHWLSMGDYSGYIWPAYSLVFVVLVINLLRIKWQRMKVRKILQAWFNVTNVRG